jgi:hypothetical protein
MSFMARATVSTTLYEGTITAALSSSTDYTGYSAVLDGGFGSRSPSTLTTGNTFRACYDDSRPASATLQISGFSSNPGKEFIRNVVTGPIPTTLTGAAATYSYSSGVATWTWASTFGFSKNVTYACTING